MPFTKVLCCKSDTPCSVEECLDHAASRDNSCPYTYELLSAMLSSAVAHPSNEDGERISTTVLTSKCLRQTALERVTPYVVKPDELWAQFRGTMFHKQLEAMAHDNAYAEHRFFIDDMTEKVPGLVLAKGQRADFSGSPDLVVPGKGILYDYKRTKEVPRFDNVWGDHKEQLNINRWLIDHADRVATPDGEVFNLIDPETRKRFTPMEWQELIIVYVDDKGPKPLVCMKSIDVPKKGGDGTKKARVPDVWSDEQVEELIRERYAAARNAFDKGIAPIPVGWEHQSHVLCGYCPVRSECAMRERQGE